MSSGGWFEYGPGPVRLRRSSAFSILRGVRGGPFRMMELNVVGWSALLAPPAVVGGVVALTLGRPVAVGALGGAGAALVVAVAWDRRRWSNSVVSVSSNLHLDDPQTVADRLRAGGVDVTVAAIDRGLIVQSDSGDEHVEHWRLTTHQRWMNRVLAALDDASAARPPHRNARRQAIGSKSGSSIGSNYGTWGCFRRQPDGVVVGCVPWWRQSLSALLAGSMASAGTRVDDPVGTCGTIMQVKAGRFFNSD